MLVFMNSKDKVSPTIVGAGAFINGDIKTEHTVQIHGTLKGNISAHTLIIAKGGKVIGKVNTKYLFLHGSLEGPANVNFAHVFNEAKMIGTLSYSILNINGNTGLECKLAKNTSPVK